MAPQNLQRLELFNYILNLMKRGQQFKKPSHNQTKIKYLQISYQKPMLSQQKSSFIPKKEETQRKCIYCLKMIKNDEYSQHRIKCKQVYMKLIEVIQYKKCQYCKAQIPSNDIKQHQDSCLYQKIKCKKCSSSYFKFQSYKHAKTCNKLSLKIPQNHKVQIIEKDSQVFFEGICKWCQQQIPESLMSTHRHICEARLSIEEQLLKCELTSNQYQTISQIYRKSSYDHQQSKAKMNENIFNMGYDEGDLILMREYLAHQAPIIIHVNLSNVINHFNNDTQYRNVFETKKAPDEYYIDDRKKWEHYLFGRAYGKSKDRQRVKYGVINYTNDKYGFYVCQQYGKSIIVLKQHVRKRCTIAHNRKYAENEIVATLRYCYSVLSLFEPQELKALYLASKGFEVESSNLSKLKQIHVHGPIKLARDLECIYTSKSQLSKLKKQVAIFTKKFGVQILEFKTEQFQVEQKKQQNLKKNN